MALNLAHFGVERLLFKSLSDCNGSNPDINTET
jgi:hypothetical protein